jgi:thiosulfate dehydrogenase
MNTNKLRHLYFSSIIMSLFALSVITLNCSSSDVQLDLKSPEFQMASLKEKAAYERGQEIWLNSQLGRNGRSCESCHPSGDLTNAYSYPKYKGILERVATLSLTHNFAVVNENKGDPWVIGSDDANSLILFVKSLSNGRKVQMGWPREMRDQCIEKGKRLFSATELGTNGKSCNSCHVDGGKKEFVFNDQHYGSLRSIAARYPRYSFRNGRLVTIEQEINYCIAHYLANDQVMLDDENLVALVCYVTSLSEGKKVRVFPKNY